MDIIKTLEQEFSLKHFQVENTVKLIDEGNTIPFIARYRKELTGSLDDQILRELSERLLYLRNLEDKKVQVKKLIDEQGNLTNELSLAIDNAVTITEVDDLYRPFRPKRRTRATIAKEKGLQPLADLIFEQELDKHITEYATEYIDAEKGVETAEEALKGAGDIIAETISDDPVIRKLIRKLTFKEALLRTKATDSNAESVYEMYYDFYEPVSKIAGHRILAVNRGESEGFISVAVEVDSERILKTVESKIIKKDNPYSKAFLDDVIADAYKRLIQPSIEREIRNEITEKAEEGAIKIFSENLKQLLLSPPIKGKSVLAVDPAFRTGCKIAAVDETGKVLHTGVIYPTPPQNKTEEAKKSLKEIIAKHNIDLICIGNGTASRETELFIAELIKELDKKLNYIIVNEAGASVYSASKLGAKEFPDFDVALRSAVSIGRRLQDPLAELVKIDPKSIGVGQYQHDMNQKKLGEALGGVVEDCVNSVGVDVNTASPSLLSYVAGINSQTASNILKYREEKGKFKERKELLKVGKLGPKAFEQCAGFLRITDGENPFDNTAVHPESYKAAMLILKKIGEEPDSLREKKITSIKARIGDLESLSTELEIGIPTILDIINELEKPGRDPREELPPPILRSDVLEIKDLKEGMILKGTVRNVIDFGAFVDIGVHQDGLVHISQMTDKFIKHPLEVVSVGDIVSVKILGVDEVKKRIALSMKGIS